MFMSSTHVISRVRSARIVFNALLCLLVSSAATLSVCAQEAWNVHDNVPREQISVMARRGMGAEAPENTMESFFAAWSLGEAPEAHLRTTKDGVIVCFRDEDFQRILPDAPIDVRFRAVRELTLEELMKLDVGAYRGESFKGQHVATMPEIVEALRADKSRCIFFDFKNVDLVQLAKQTRDVWPQIYLISSDARIIEMWKEVAPTSKTCWSQTRLMPINDPIMSAEALKFLEYKRIVVDMFQASVRFEPDGTLKQSSEPIAEVASKARECGVLMQITPEYLVNQTDSYKVLLDAGVTAFSTVYPSVAKRALDEYYQVPPANADNASPNN